MSDKKEEQFTQMYALYTAGMSIREVAKEFGVKYHSVWMGFTRRGWRIKTRTEGRNDMYKRKNNLNSNKI